jgi:exopolysaccharide biosynthesis polyprenyl glycosylphosphotransferase
VRRQVARLILTGGTITLSTFFTVAHARSWAPELYHPVANYRFPWIVGFVAVLLAASYASGLPDLPKTRTSALVSAISSIGVAAVAISIIQLVAGTPLLPRAVVTGISLTFAPLGVAAWNLQRDLSGFAATRVFFVGRSDEYSALATELANDHMSRAILVGQLSSTEVLATQPDGEPLVLAARSAQPDLLVLDSASLAEPSVVSQAAILHQGGVRVRTVSLFTEEYLGKIPITDLERVSLLFDIGEIHRAQYVRAKRVVDSLVGIAAVIVLMPVSALVLVANLFGNKGSLFYSQVRVGKDGAPFKIYKFRSMVASTGPSDWTTEDDPRITPFGSFLRRTHLDELPQAWNILRGDLSIVGPRPEQLHYVERLREKIPFYDVRHLVRPGVSGWAQIMYPYGADEEDAREKLQYDLYYLRRQSLMLDLTILARTIRTVVRATGT